jgi:hypothetical protein
MRQTLPAGLTNTFLWSEELGQGWHTAPPMNYSGDYFAKYQDLDNTKMGAELTRARLELVGKFVKPNTVLDIGIGGGRFVQESGGHGYDVSTEANSWLMKNKLYRNAEFGWPAMSFWDSLEHIPDPEEFVSKVGRWMFVSMPIYTGMADVLASKHYKPGEHLHYWTFDGFVAWCGRQGLELMEMNHAETELGREGITSFAFKRVDQ